MSEKEIKNKKKKNKNPKFWLIIIPIVIIVCICLIITIYNNKSGKSKLNKLYEMLEEKKSYSFTATLDNKNKMYYAELKNDKAYINTLYKGTETEYIIKDGNTYLIMDDVKEYYIYKNNQADFGKIEIILEDLEELEHKRGKEKINNKTYKYEEYEGLTQFAFLDTSNIRDEQEVKTRFYFKGNDLVYIKTIIGEKEELLKIDISNKVDKKIFEIPSEYKEM